MPEHAPRKAAGARKAAHAKAEAAETAETSPVADATASPDPDTSQEPAGSVDGQDEALTPREYRAKASMHEVRIGDTFYALPDDPRVKSGYAELVEEDAPPDDVQAALDS